MKKLPSEQIVILNTNIPLWINSPKEGQGAHTFIIAKSGTKSSLEKNKEEYLVGINRIKKTLEADRSLRQHLEIFLENTIENPKDIRDLFARNSITL